jgi:hypothetical protein
MTKNFHFILFYFTLCFKLQWCSVKSYACGRFVQNNGINNAPANLAARVPCGSGGTPNVQNTKNFMCSFGLDSIVLTEGSILDPCYEM